MTGESVELSPLLHSSSKINPWRVISLFIATSYDYMTLLSKISPAPKKS